ncbi:hypothetical protein PoB_005369600 [Plakobranchus ocellatus]|uniref:Uncharacterized protein n=1 Tax=Plakobranchus ocellatus TaxID=259542 RepID=A0AAV4BVG8_9GAST|nr:hypothetical protein PoB_005369600 [Plakobranchus ocellatus]
MRENSSCAVFSHTHRVKSLSSLSTPVRRTNNEISSAQLVFPSAACLSSLPLGHPCLDTLRPNQTRCGLARRRGEEAGRKSRWLFLSSAKGGWGDGGFSSCYPTIPLSVHTRLIQMPVWTRLGGEGEGEREKQGRAADTQRLITQHCTTVTAASQVPASPQQDAILRLPSGQSASSGARTRDRRVHVDLRTDSLITE